VDAVHLFPTTTKKQKQKSNKKRKNTIKLINALTYQDKKLTQLFICWKADHLDKKGKKK
jgi:hypothetical protein